MCNNMEYVVPKLLRKLIIILLAKGIDMMFSSIAEKIIRYCEIIRLA